MMRATALPALLMVLILNMTLCVTPAWSAPPVKVVHPKQKLVKVAKHKHRPWRHGLKWRWIVVPSIYLAEELDWCVSQVSPMAEER